MKYLLVHGVVLTWIHLISSQDIKFPDNEELTHLSGGMKNVIFCFTNIPIIRKK